MGLYINKKSQIMRKIRKLLWMIFILWIVFFIICDEKWYKIWFENSQIVFNKIEKKPDSVEVQPNPNAVYKNSDWIHINYEFENPRNLRKSNWVDREYIAKLEQEKKIENEKLKEQERLDNHTLNDSDSISSIFQWLEKQDTTWNVKRPINQRTWTINTMTNQNVWTGESESTWKIEEEEQVVYYPVKKYKFKNHIVNMSKWVQIPRTKIEMYELKDNLVLNASKGKAPEPKILYKNSNRIKIYSWFENPQIMRNSAGIDEEFIAQMNNKATIILLDDENNIFDIRWIPTEDSEINSWDNFQQQNEVNSEWNNENISNPEENISNPEENIDTDQDTEDLNDNMENLENNRTSNDVSNDEFWEIINNNSDFWNIFENSLNNEIDTENWINIWEMLENTENIEDVKNIDDLEDIEKIEIITYEIDKYEPSYHSINISKWKPTLVPLEKYEITSHKFNIYKGKLPKTFLAKIKKPRLHQLDLKKWKPIEHNFVVEENDNTNTEKWLSDPVLQNLLENEEIDIDTLESDNDEFLQKVFEKTKDTDVMNLIVENYLNEYQFVKAKRFIENLPNIYRDELKPSLNLRVAFNSFSLSSKTINENLTSIVQDYSSQNKILAEDKNRYLWVIALIDRNYDRFFEISTWFTSERNKAFASKLQWYKDQIAKQMWMPDYYFDTLVSLELFNQWLFQPAKILALYSLQQNSNYILPYQVLAYANFLTNSRDTSIEYLKKLVDLDPKNTEKYHFLMWVAFYRDEKYEQSVVMLSMIKDENLRLDTQRYLINNYIKLDQKNKLIANRNKMLWYENLVASDFYTYFYETFFHPYSEWEEFQLYAYDTELANKMLRVCSITLQNEEKAVCTYGTIGRNIAMWQFDGLEQYLLNLATEYPQWYLYQALWDYYIQQWDLEKAKVYLIKAISLTQKKSERSQIKKLLQDAM